MAMEPDYEEAIGLIKHLPTEELKELANNDDKLSSLIADLPQIRNLGSEQDMLLAGNKSIAEYNLSLEPKLSQGKQDLISKYNEASTLAAELSIMKSQIDSSSNKQPADTIQALLKTAAHEMEEETEKLWQNFDGNRSAVDDFLSEFLEKRTIAHLRRIKAEKCGSIIQGAQLLPSPPSNMLPPLQSNSWGAPYPQQMCNMPLPGYS